MRTAFILYLCPPVFALSLSVLWGLKYDSDTNTKCMNAYMQDTMQILCRGLIFTKYETSDLTGNKIRAKKKVLYLPDSAAQDDCCDVIWYDSPKSDLSPCSMC